MSKQPLMFAAIHVGSEHISLQIVEYRSIEDMRIVDRASRQVSLGEETFKNGRISFAAISELCDLLKGYRRLCNEYGVRDYRLLATTAIREAENQQYIMDQIRIKTGLIVQVVDLPQEIFFKYTALFRTAEHAGLAQGDKGLLFVDFSSGGLGVTLYKQGKILYQQNIHIGALRIKESFEKHQRESAYFQQALNEYILSTIEPLQEELSRHAIKYMILSGTETRLLLRMLDKQNAAVLLNLDQNEFYQLYERVKILNLPQIMKKFNLSEGLAEIVLPTIVLYKQILDIISIDKMLVADVHFIDGMILLHVGEKTKSEWLSVMETQIVSLARAIGEKYGYDEQHAACVEMVSLQLFDYLARIHGLDRRERLLLQVAAILHDIGKYVSLRKHYFYSHNLIESSDILGFSEEEKSVIANVAFYHSKGTPNNLDVNFAKLNNRDKMTVAKLAALIRLADAMDRTHRQKAKSFEVSLKGEELYVRLTAKEDYSLEEWTFQDKAEFFENVFGIKAKLIRQIG
jgi:exopolyphosphatase/guanosine-5'-triphosphate,3'-diphosphate pyrophosphatase